VLAARLVVAEGRLGAAQVGAGQVDEFDFVVGGELFAVVGHGGSRLGGCRLLSQAPCQTTLSTNQLILLAFPAGQTSTCTNFVRTNRVMHTVGANPPADDAQAPASPTRQAVAATSNSIPSSASRGTGTRVQVGRCPAPKAAASSSPKTASRGSSWSTTITVRPTTSRGAAPAAARAMARFAKACRTCSRKSGGREPSSRSPPCPATSTRRVPVARRATCE